MNLKKLALMAFALLIFGEVYSQNRSKPPFESYPKIADSTIFTNWVKQFIEPNFKENIISYYKKVKINGSSTPYYLIEYDYGDGPDADYPWKFQLLFTPDGRLVRMMDGTRFEFVNIFPGENPHLLVLYQTAKGNGSHSIYKLSKGELINVFEGSMEFGDGSNWVRTCDTHEDGMVFEPGELRLIIKDFNADGVNDIAFVGDQMNDDKSVLINHLLLIYIFDRHTGRFRGKEDYNEIYNLLGDE